MAELDEKLLKSLDDRLKNMLTTITSLDSALNTVVSNSKSSLNDLISLFQASGASLTDMLQAFKGNNLADLLGIKDAAGQVKQLNEQIETLKRNTRMGGKASWVEDEDTGRGAWKVLKGDEFKNAKEERDAINALAEARQKLHDLTLSDAQLMEKIVALINKAAVETQKEESAKERDFQKAVKQQEELARKYAELEKLRSETFGGRSYGQLSGKEKVQWTEMGDALRKIKTQMEEIEKSSTGSKAEGERIFKEQEAIAKAKLALAEKERREKEEAARQEKELNKAIAEEARRKKEDENEYLRLLKERNKLLEQNARLAENKRNAGLTGYIDTSNYFGSQQDKNDARLRQLNDEIQLYEESVKLTADGQRRKEEMELAHENRMTEIKVQGEQKREQILDRSSKKRQSESERNARKAESIQKQADTLSKRRIDLNNEISRIEHDRVIRQKTNANISQQALDAEEKKYQALKDMVDQLTKSLEELEKKQKGVTAKAEAKNAPYQQYTQAKEEERVNVELERRNKLLKDNKRTMDSMLPTLQRLASAFGIAFSVRGLAQFGKKLIETRGEFEMQFVAMKQIIGDVDAATKIWNQTMQQALQSPFKAMQLVTYTKQLAAYRIETEKLFDTTKRLADISAGLGVDMGRLILAFGQVKSANFLRASEVRQFTEAGVNIVGNLAKYFTELEGRAVGTAEVMERITKRMVLFSDVEAIFKRMTDEGGEFYNMQEVQADTVKGQIQKLHDAYDQMLNTIGQANQGTIRNFVDTLNNLVRNWQDVAFVLKANINWITIFGASLYALSNKYMKGATTQTLWFGKALLGNDKVLLKNVADVRIFGKVLGDFTLKQRVAIVATRTFQSALSAVGNVMKTLWPLLVFEGITLLIERLTRASRELKRFREELQDVASTNVGQMDEEINGYDSLIERLKRTTEGTMARKEVLDEISRRYGKYLDFIITEKTSVEQLAGAYDKVVSSIRNYTAEKIREEQMQRVEKGIYDEYQGLISNLIGSRNFTTDTGLSKDHAKAFAKYVQSSVKEGITDSKKIIEDYFKIELPTSANTPMMHFVRTYIDQYKNMYSELQDIRDDVEGVTPVFATDAEYQTYKKNVEDANKEIAAQNELYQQQVDLVKQKTEEQWKIDDEIAKLRLENEEKILGIRKEYGLISEGQYKDELARLHGRLDTYETDYNQRLENAMISKYGIFWQTSNKEARDMYNYVVSTEQALAQGTTQRNKQLKDSYKGFKDSLEQYNTQYQAAVNSGASKEALDKIQADIDLAKLMMAAIELAANLRGIDLSEKKKSTRTTHENASKLISLIKEMRSEYDKLSKSAYGYAKSEEKVREAYRDSVKEILGRAGITDYDFTTNEGMIKALEKVKSYATKLGKDAAAEVQKYIDQLETEIEINAQVRIREDFGKQMEKAFNDYELTLELDKLNLPKGLAADMWGIEETDLQDLRKKLSQMYMGLRDENGQLSDEAFKDYEKFLNKIDDLERKQQKERLKDYSKYLEAQYSERVKIEMDYVRKLAALEAETAIKEPQKREIREGLKREFLEKSRKQDWEDFKGSEFYVGMMEDLEKQGSASLEVMRKKLLEMRENAENLSPRALKEVVNALEKIDELEKKRIPSLKRIREEQEKLKGIEIKGVYERIAANQEKLAQDEQEQRDLERMIMLEEERQKLEKQGVTLEEAKARLARSEQALSVILPSLDMRSDGTKEAEERNRILTETVNRAKKEVETWAEIVRILSGQATIDEQERGSKYKGLSLSDLKKRRDDAKQRIKDLEGVIGKDEELVKAQKDLEDAWNDTWEAAKRWAQSINGIFDGVMDTVGYFSDSTSTLTDGWKEFGDTSISALTDLVSGIQAYQQANAAAQKAGRATGLFTANGLQLAMVVLGVIIKIVQAIAKMHDARIDKEIEQSKERVNDLQKAYDRLEKSIEKTFDTVSYIREYNQEVQNLNEQIEEANNQIAAAQDYKNAEKKKEAIEAAEDAKQEALDALDEIKQKQIEVFGGIGKDNYRSAAEGFVEAWKSAFLETGDGLQGLQDHFDEFLNDWFVKQATMRYASAALEPVFKMIDDAVSTNGAGGANVLMQELENIKEWARVNFPQISDTLEEISRPFIGEGEGSLSGLAAGIQGMTEEQANILEAYWNSVRGYTANIDMNVSRIAQILGAGGDNTNPMLVQMTLVAQNTNNIRTLLESVRFNGGEGAGIRVYSY